MIDVKTKSQPISIPLDLLELIENIRGDINRSRFVVSYLCKGLYDSGKLPREFYDLLPKEEQKPSRPLIRA